MVLWPGNQISPLNQRKLDISKDINGDFGREILHIEEQLIRYKLNSFLAILYNVYIRVYVLITLIYLITSVLFIYLFIFVYLILIYFILTFPYQYVLMFCILIFQPGRVATLVKSNEVRKHCIIPTCALLYLDDKHTKQLLLLIYQFMVYWVN